MNFKGLCWLLFFCCFTGQWASAQSRDSIFAVEGEYGWEVKYKVEKGATVFSISRYFHVPPAVLARLNRLDYKTELSPSQVVRVPLGAYNFMNKPNQLKSGAKPLYFKFKSQTTLHQVAKNSGVPQKNIQLWNDLDLFDPEPGTRLLVGWILIDDTPIVEPNQSEPDNTGRYLYQGDKSRKAIKQVEEETAYNKPADLPVKQDKTASARKEEDSALSAFVQPKAENPENDFEKLYMEQTYQEQSFREETGTAVFYGKEAPAVGDLYYAFHNTTPKGTILKITNTGNGKFIFAKVLGPIPQTRLYHNSIVGISASAKKALAVAGEKAWCQLSFAH